MWIKPCQSLARKIWNHFPLTLQPCVAPQQEHKLASQRFPGSNLRSKLLADGLGGRSGCNVFLVWRKLFSPTFAPCSSSGLIAVLPSSHSGLHFKKMFSLSFFYTLKIAPTRAIVSWPIQESTSIVCSSALRTGGSSFMIDTGVGQSVLCLNPEKHVPPKLSLEEEVVRLSQICWVLPQHTHHWT